MNCITRLESFFGSLVFLSLAGITAMPAHAATETAARVVKYSKEDIVSVHAKLRFSTLIVLPEDEEILDFTTGDKEFWVINGAHNLCYVHPAQARHSQQFESHHRERSRLLVLADQNQQPAER